uniref:BMP family ABC transporter substrate-binding protein n=1 Tax=Vaginimicrobium propionicum TaxID=1871034 RepID=UPI0009703C5D|nr:BMP family ABC transporter substrate-binding protein [Vaginimicrobium propionicum]
MKRSLTMLGAALVLLLAGCATPPAAKPAAESSATPTPLQFRACLISADTTTVSMQASQALAQAKTELGVETSEILSDDFAIQLQKFVDDGCQIIFGVGESVAEAIQAGAKENPQVKFVLVDTNASESLPNLKVMVFNTHEVGFLAGYLAASQTQSGKVGVFGGLFVPAVTMYLDGFVQGVNYYNEQKSAKVEVLGWDLATKKGESISTAKPFNDPAAGETLAKKMVLDGVDVLMPVAGESGTGALASDAKIIWTDSDGCKTTSGCDKIIGSATKDIAAGVYEIIEKAITGDFTNALYIGTVKNGGAKLVGVKAEQGVVSELDAAERGIISGNITVTSDSAIG